MTSPSSNDRPKRDVSANSAIGECDDCGGNAHSLLGGEHIWKCSEVVPKETLEQFIDALRDSSGRNRFSAFDSGTAVEIADELEVLIE